MAISKITSDAIDATGFNLDSDTLTIDATNNRVGVGTASPTARMSIEQSGTGDFDSIILSRTTGNVGDAQSVVWQQNDLSNLKAASISGEVTGASAGALAFNTASGGTLSERMRIDSTGRQIVGHTSSVGTAFQTNLQVKGSSSSNYGGLGVISSNNEMLGIVGVWSHAENSLFIAADPDNLRTSSSIVFTADAVETMRVNGEGLKIRGSSFGLVTNPGQTTITLANNAAINLTVSGTATAGGGILCIYEPASGENAVYHVGYNRGNLISNSNGSLFATGTTSGKNTIQVSGHQITFTNRTGSSRGYVFNLFIAGGNAYNQ